jgi:hypothetical protein
MAVIDLVPRVRKALGVSSSYDATDVPEVIRGAIRRLLRDYNFPKSLRRAYLGTGPAAADGSGPTLVADEDLFDLPAGFKKDLQLRFRDPADDTWSDPLERTEAFVLPTDSVTQRYWLEGVQLGVDFAIGDDGVGKQLVLFYQSLLVDSTSEDWMTTDFTDAVAYLSIMRGALDFRKPDVAKDYSGLWTDEQTSLAIYLNELEWSNVVINQRETYRRVSARYPANACG